MNYIKIFLVTCLISTSFFNLSGQTTSTLSLVEASGGCGQMSDCSVNRICFDVMVTPDTTGTINSYNIWIQYPPGGTLFYASDNACRSNNGPDNNFDSQGYYRFSGVQGSGTVIENVPVKLHNICFTYITINAINNEVISIGGTVFGVLNSTMTYSLPILNEPNMPAYPFTLNAGSVSCILLPVTWLDFKVMKVNNTSELDWTTTDEFNNRGFEIQRSIDGKDFEKIGWVDAISLQTSVNAYQFIDLFTKKGTNYYRLKQMDWDGHFDFSPIRSVIINDSNFSVEVMPNPAKEYFNITIRTQESFSEISLIDLTGKVVLKEKVNSIDLTTHLPIDHLVQGAYTLVVVSGIERFTQRLVVVK
ncbi:MAG: T9SS type A sorting domain-containing protein [Saprospiraceae bacterium]